MPLSFDLSLTDWVAVACMAFAGTAGLAGVQLSANARERRENGSAKGRAFGAIALTSVVSFLCGAIAGGQRLDAHPYPVVAIVILGTVAAFFGGIVAIGVGFEWKPTKKAKALI